MKKAKWILSILLLFIIISLAISPNIYIEACENGIIVWATVILPAIFPFLFFTKILTDLGIINIITNKFKIFANAYKTKPISLYAFCMSILSGYPVGAKVVCDLYQKGFIDKQDAFKISTFTSNSGPMFILGSVGIGMLHSKTLGLIMLFSHIFGALLNGLIYRNYKVKNNTNNRIKILNEKNIISLGDTMRSSINAILIIGGFIAIFFVIIEILNNLDIIYFISNLIGNLFKIDTSLFSGIFNGIFEMTHGCLDISTLNLPQTTLACICTALITFGGIATMLQAYTFLQKFDMTLSFFLLQKTTHTIISTIICFTLCYLLI